jgi:hypothetical protein
MRTCFIITPRSLREQSVSEWTTTTGAPSGHSAAAIESRLNLAFLACKVLIDETNLGNINQERITVIHVIYQRRSGHGDLFSGQSATNEQVRE